MLSYPGEVVVYFLQSMLLHSGAQISCELAILSTY
jgi:hypothetical protein